MTEKQRPTKTTYYRSAYTGGVAFLGPTAFVPLLEYFAQIEHLDPVPSMEVFHAAAGILSALFVIILSFIMRASHNEIYPTDTSAPPPSELHSDQ